MEGLYKLTLYEDSDIACPPLILFLLFLLLVFFFSSSSSLILFFQDGTVLMLIYSASKTADDILHKLKKGVLEEKRDALIMLVKMSSDITFAQEFIAKQVSCCFFQNFESLNGYNVKQKDIFREVLKEYVI